MPTFKNDTKRYIDHWCTLQAPEGTPQRVLIRFAPGEERRLTFWVPHVRLGLTLVSANDPKTPDTILTSGTYAFEPGVERRFNIEMCDTYAVNIIVQKGRVMLFPADTRTGVEVRQDAEVPFHYRAVFDWEYAPFFRVVGMDEGTECTVHAEINRDYPAIPKGAIPSWR